MDMDMNMDYPVPTREEIINNKHLVQHLCYFTGGAYIPEFEDCVLGTMWDGYPTLSLVMEWRVWDKNQGIALKVEEEFAKKYRQQG